MDSFVVALGSALWLGILTSVSPCPLATNVAAISYVGRRMDHPWAVGLSGLAYTAGRALSYTVLGALLVSSLLTAPRLSHVLQKNMNQILGPVLIVVGMMLLELISLRLPSSGWTERAGERVAGKGLLGAAALGCLFALSFCPISAALFFGSLIPLALEHRSGLLLPAVYGLGTGIQVLGLAMALALGLRSLGAVFHRVERWERWTRRITGLIFVGVGIYYCLAYVFKVFR